MVLKRLSSVYAYCIIRFILKVDTWLQENSLYQNIVYVIRVEISLLISKKKKTCENGVCQLTFFVESHRHIWSIVIIKSKTFLCSCHFNPSIFIFHFYFPFYKLINESSVIYFHANKIRNTPTWVYNSSIYINIYLFENQFFCIFTKLTF